MKVVVIILLIIFYSTVYGQKITINQVLNSALYTEQKLQRSQPANNYKINWQYTYRLKDNLLSIRFTKTDTLTQCSCIVYRTVNITKIKAVAKDINVVFLTIPHAVKEVFTYNSCVADSNTPRAETHYSDMFFTEIKVQKNNEDLGKRLQQAFAENGLKINVPYWYD